MKLRNKKTGEIVEGKCFTDIILKLSEHSDFFCSKNLNLNILNEYWEEYKGTEPLIKDEKIRKAVRAWADANELTVVRVFYIDETETLKLDSGVNLISISFESEEDYSHLNRETHTITELCGEEE